MMPRTVRARSLLALALVVLIAAVLAVYAWQRDPSPPPAVAVPEEFCGALREECQRLIDEAVEERREAALCYGTGFTTAADVKQAWAQLLPGANWSLGAACRPSPNALQLGFVRAVVRGESVSFEPPEVTALARYLELRASPNPDDRAAAYASLPPSMQELVPRDEYVRCTATAPIESIVGVLRVAPDPYTPAHTDVTIALAVYDRATGLVTDYPALHYSLEPLGDRLAGGEAGRSCFPEF
jgi:hypothetical protein